MFGAMFKTLTVFFEPAFWSVLAKALALSIPLFAGVLWLGLWGAEQLPQTGWSWLDWAIDGVASLAAVLAAVIIFPALASMMMGLFVDEAAAAVEQRHYPQDPPGKAIGAWPGLVAGIRLAMIMLVVNALALPFYLAFIFFPLLSVFLYYLVNGWLLKREYFELICLRHTTPEGFAALRRAGGLRLFLAGCAIAFVFTVPLVNLVAPLLGAGLMVHMYKDIERKVNQGAGAHQNDQ